MPRIKLGDVKTTLFYTAVVPEDIVTVLAQEKLAHPFQGLGMHLGTMPSLSVGQLRRIGVSMPGQWSDANRIFPVVPGLGFGLELTFATDYMVASVAYKGRNILTGEPECSEFNATRRSYWRTCQPQIVSYRPQPMAKVMQFVGSFESESRLKDNVSSEGVLDGLKVSYFLASRPEELAARLHSERGLGGERWQEYGPNPWLSMMYRFVSVDTFNTWAASLDVGNTLAISQQTINNMFVHQQRFTTRWYERYLPGKPIRVQMPVRKAEDAETGM